MDDLIHRFFATWWVFHLLPCERHGRSFPEKLYQRVAALRKQLLDRREQIPDDFLGLRGPWGGGPKELRRYLRTYRLDEKKFHGMVTEIEALLALED